MKRAALYIRVSTAEQRDQGLSVESQIAALRKYCQDNGYQEVGIYNDAGISARCNYKRRPALLQMVSDCQNKKVDIILVTKLDRFFRSVPDYYSVMEQIGDVPWRAIWEDYETETSSGVFKVNIMLSIAQAESDRTSERIKSVNDYRRAQGKFVGGHAPFGYLKKDGELIKNELVQDAVNAFFREYLSTLSLNRAMDAAGRFGAHINVGKAARMIKSEVYAGNAYGYQCEPYITLEEYNYIVGYREGRPSRPRERGRTYFYTGILKCPGCNGPMVGHYQRVNEYHYKVYRCASNTNRNGCEYTKAIYENTIEKFLINNLEALTEGYIAETEHIVNRNQNSAVTVKKLKDKLKRIGDRYEDGDISREEYRAKREAINAEIAKYSTNIVDISSVRLPDDWRSTYDSLDDDHKQMYWSRLLSRIEYTGPKSFQVTFR